MLKMPAATEPGALLRICSTMAWKGLSFWLIALVS